MAGIARALGRGALPALVVLTAAAVAPAATAQPLPARHLFQFLMSKRSARAVPPVRLPSVRARPAPRFPPALRTAGKAPGTPTWPPPSVSPTGPRPSPPRLSGDLLRRRRQLSPLTRRVSDGQAIDARARDLYDWRSAVPEGVTIRPAERDLPFVGAPRPRYLAVYPGDDVAYRKMYGRGLSARSKARFDAHAQDVADLGGVAIDAGGVDDLLAAIREGPGEGPVFISGHSTDDGAMLVMPQGDPLGVDALHAACRDAGVQCVVVTCYSKDLGLTTQIYPDEATAIVASGIDRIRTHAALPPVGRDDGRLVDFVIKGMVQDLERSRAVRAAAQVVTVSAAGAGAYHVLKDRD